MIALWLALAQDAIVLKGGTVHVGDGRELAGVTILIRGGKIEAVGDALEAPEGAAIVTVPANYHVAPGFIDLHSHLGMSAERDEPARAITPHMRASDGYSTDREDVRAARLSGVTCVALSPGEINLVGGAMSVVRLGPGHLHEVLVEPVAALKLSIGSEAMRRDREPTSLAGALALLGDHLADADSESFKRLVKEKRPAFVHAQSAEEIARALKLKTAHGLRLVLLHARDADEMAESIKAAAVPVVLGPLTTLDDDRALSRPAALSRAGIMIGFATDGPEIAEDQLRQSAILAVHHGLPRDAALRALTSDAARILGLEARIGTIEAGRDADVVVYTGHPLAPTSRVDRVIVGGKIAP